MYISLFNHHPGLQNAADQAIIHFQEERTLNVPPPHYETGKAIHMRKKRNPQDFA